MKIKSDFTIQKVGTSYVAVPVGNASITFNAMINMNETGAFIWNMYAEKDCTEEEVVDALCKEYDAPREVIARDVRAITAKLAENKIFEENA